MNTTPMLVATSAPIGAPGQRPSFTAGEELRLKGLIFKVRKCDERGVVAEVMMTAQMCPCGQERVWAKMTGGGEANIPHPDGWCSDYLTAEVRAAQERVLRSRFHETLRIQVKGYWFAVSGINGCYLTFLYHGRSSKGGVSGNNGRARRRGSIVRHHRRPK